MSLVPSLLALATAASQPAAGAGSAARVTVRIAAAARIRLDGQGGVPPAARQATLLRRDPATGLTAALHLVEFQ